MYNLKRLYNENDNYFGNMSMTSDIFRYNRLEYMHVVINTPTSNIANSTVLSKNINNLRYFYVR